MRLRWTLEATADANAIQMFVGEDSPTRARNVRAALAAAGESLTQFPLSGKEGRVAGTRELRVRRSPYALIYRVSNDTVEVLRIMHGARLWPPR